MVFQDVVRARGRVQARVAAGQRVRYSVRLWTGVFLAGTVLYLSVCGYVYQLSCERHRLLLERNRLQQQHQLLQGQREALRHPARIQKEARRYGMVLLVEPQAVRNTPVVIAQKP